MASLEDRLRAYAKKSPPAQPQADTPGQPSDARRDHAADISIHKQIYQRHPVSHQTLHCGEKLAFDFRRDIAPQDLLFFDLESTGLGSSEQTYPFLIGFATHDGTHTEVVQCFATTPAGEEDILAAFMAATPGKTLVSFNGKSFDLPLIIRRAAKYNLQHTLGDLPHIDLYHLIRRIYPEKPARLTDAESRLLRFSRSGDISGAEVAQSYFEYVRFANATHLEQILQHNLIDVVSLVSLSLKVSAAFTAARSGEMPWAYKIHRDKSAGRTEKKKLLQDKKELDARDLHMLGEILRAEKQYRAAARLFCSSYRAGYPRAVVDAVRCIKRLKDHDRRAAALARFALAREDERVQSQLVRFV